MGQAAAAEGASATEAVTQQLAARDATAAQLREQLQDAYQSAATAAAEKQASLLTNMGRAPARYNRIKPYENGIDASTHI